MWKIIPKGLILVQICLKIFNEEGLFSVFLPFSKKSQPLFFLKKIHRHDKLPNVRLGITPKLIVQKMAISNPKTYGLLIPPFSIKINFTPS